MRNYNVPSELQPLSPWNYFWLMILYDIPIIGFIFLLIHAIGAQNVNKKNFARSFFCVLVIVGILVLILFSAGVLGTIASAF